MSQMPVQINPAAPSPSGKGGAGDASTSQGQGDAFDRALRQAGTPSGGGPSNGGAGAEGPSRLEGRRSFAGESPGPREGSHPGGRESDLARELARMAEKGGQSGPKGSEGGRLMAAIQDLLEQGKVAGQDREEAKETLLDLLARFREGDEGQSLGGLLSGGKSDKGSTPDQEGYALLSALSLKGLSFSGGNNGSSTQALASALTGGQSQPNSGQTIDALIGQLQGQSGSAARGEGEAARGQVAEGRSQESGNRLAGAEVTGREASARGESGVNGQGVSSRQAAPSSAPRVVQGQQTVPQAMVQVAKEANDGQRDVRLQLNPPNLGQVRVELQMTDQRVQAIFHVDNRHAAGLLDSQMSTLRNALQEQQLDLEDAQVQLSNPDNGEGEKPPWEQGDDGRRGPWTAWGQEEGGNDGGGEAASEGPRIEGGLSLYA